VWGGDGVVGWVAAGVKGTDQNEDDAVKRGLRAFVGPWVADFPPYRANRPIGTECAPSACGGASMEAYRLLGGR
jgi:hypothetical protein